MLPPEYGNPIRGGGWVCVPNEPQPFAVCTWVGIALILVPWNKQIINKHIKITQKIEDVLNKIKYKT